MKFSTSIRIFSAILLATAVLFVSFGAVMAEESLQLQKPVLSDSGISSSKKPIINLTLQPQQPIIVGQLPVENTPSCVCTNLNYVTVICEDCDKETNEDLCHTHDRACKDAAQMGGIRESDTFFCTTLVE